MNLIEDYWKSIGDPPFTHNKIKSSKSTDADHEYSSKPSSLMSNKKLHAKPISNK